LHPDLGIGGAENLIINLALALEKKNYDVKIYTPHFDPNRCFQECHQLNIEVAGSWFPRTIFGRFIAYCAYVRMVFCAIYVAFFSGVDYDYFLLDQVSFPIPILKMKTSKIVFYCHFPDKLLSTNRSSFIMQFYRYFLDYLEEVTTGMAQTIVVNSLFTQKVFQENFPIIAD
jgi:alpha-1,3/alpha-1,6-mannosyltransferase